MGEPILPDEVPVDDNQGDDPTPPAPSADEVPKEPDPVPYSRFKEVNDAKADKEAEIERMREEHEAELEKVRNEKATPDEDPWEDEDAPVTKKELKEMQQKKDKEIEDKKVLETVQARHSELEKLHDGKDGLPVYNKKEIESFAHKNKFFPQDPDDVYQKMHRAEIVQAEAKKLVAAGKGVHVEKNKAPNAPDTKDTSKMTTEEYDEHVRSLRS